MYTPHPSLSSLDVVSLGDAQAPLAGLVSAIVDEVECGLIACDGNGRLQFANRSARDELADARALHLVDGRVRCAAGHGAPFVEALRQAALHRRRQLLAIDDAGERLLVSVLPLPETAAAVSSVLVMLGRRGPCSTLGLDMLALLHGLTSTERGVLADLVGQGAPRTIAAARGVALSTVRSHIKSIREKFGVRTIEGVLVRAAEVPPVTTAWRRAGGPPHAARAAG